MVAMTSVAVVSAAGTAKKPANKPATNDNADISQEVTRSYNSDPAVQQGMIVSLKPKDASTVVPLPSNDIRSMLGVVVPPNNATIVLAPQTAIKQQVLVATTGRYFTLVSNQNGPIKVGNYITISAISGVGMKADEKQTEVIGKAAGNFSGSADVIGSVKLNDTLGRSTNVAIGHIPVDLSISHNPLFQKNADYVPGFLSKVAAGVANKPVSAARIYISMVIIIVTVLLAGNMLYGGVRSGMQAVGRNPLSRKSIIKSLIQTVTAGLIIFVAGIFGVYLLLKL